MFYKEIWFFFFKFAVEFSIDSFTEKFTSWAIFFNFQLIVFQHLPPSWQNMAFKFSVAVLLCDKFLPIENVFYLPAFVWKIMLPENSWRSFYSGGENLTKMFSGSCSCHSQSWEFLSCAQEVPTLCHIGKPVTPDVERNWYSKQSGIKGLIRTKNSTPRHY